MYNYAIVFVHICKLLCAT